MKIDLESLNITKAHNHLKNGDFSVKDLVGEYLKVIKEKNPTINAFLEIYNNIDKQVEKAEEMFKKGIEVSMTGIPIAIKDNILCEGHIASASSKILQNYKATYNSTVVEQLKSEGAIILGRTNMDEFAMGASTETSAYGNTKNPIDITRVPGGSSGGSAASVAMNSSLVALGSDTGGSVRQPASFCGVVGLKPTYGTISRYGIISLGSSLDQIGTIGKSVEDVEITFNSINKYDSLDSTSIKIENREKSTILKKRIGVPRSFLLMDGIDKEVLENFEDNIKKLESIGYEIIDISLPLIKYSLAAYYIIMPAEASSNLARYDGIRYGLSEKADILYEVYTKSRDKGFGKEVKRRILLGTYVLSYGYYDAYYNTAIKTREAIKDELVNVFKNVDAIITPTSPTLPFKFGEKIDNPVAMYMADLFTVPANITGAPAISIPSGVNKNNLPFGLHMMAPHFREDILFIIGKDFEKLI